MSITTGTRHAVAEASAWVVAAIVLVGSLVYYDDLKTMFGVAFQTAHTAIAPDTAPGRTSHAPSVPSTPPSPANAIGTTVVLDAGPNGHFYADASVNGRRLKVMVDTGASLVALSNEDAERAGIYVRPSDFTYKVHTANGPARIAIVNLDSVSINGVTVRGVRAAVSERGALRTSLLGMSFLSRLRRTEMRNGRLVLEN